MSLRDKLKKEQITAMKAKDKARLATIRSVLAEIKQREIDGQVELDEAGILAVVTKAVKQRKDSIAQFEEAGRADLVEVEQSELSVLEEFMPQPLTDAELDELIQQALTDTGASSMKEMGAVMAALKPQVQGRTDMGALSSKIRAKLA